MVVVDDSTKLLSKFGVVTFTKLATWTKTDADGDYGDCVSLEVDWPINHSDQQYINISVWHR